ncbi:MAG TPA: A24 family peptidase [Cryptosporangiaceae bacterium]|nr:A24 family peptidase [Cryptosporangiaceae bacterium]
MTVLPAVPPAVLPGVLLVVLGAGAGWLVARVTLGALRPEPDGWSVDPGHPVVDVATAVVFAVLFWLVGTAAAGPAYLYLGALALVLGAVDLARHRLPDVLTLPAYPALGALLAVASLGSGDGEALLRACFGAAACFGVYYLLAVLVPEAMGFGDVKLAGVLGLVLAWAGWASLLAGMFLGFLFGGVVSLALILSRRATRRTRIPFGPFMLVGALAALALSDRALADYAGLG